MVEKSEDEKRMEFFQKISDDILLLCKKYIDEVDSKTFADSLVYFAGIMYFKYAPSKEMALNAILKMVGEVLLDNLQSPDQDLASIEKLLKKAKKLRKQED